MLRVKSGHSCWMQPGEDMHNHASSSNIGLWYVAGDVLLAIHALVKDCGWGTLRRLYVRT